MSEATVCSVFHTFCRMFASEFYRESVNLPTGDITLTKVMSSTTSYLGFSGAIGQTDVTDLKWDCCPHSPQRSYTGKEGYATIAYCNGQRSISLGASLGPQRIFQAPTMI